MDTNCYSITSNYYSLTQEVVVKLLDKKDAELKYKDAELKDKEDELERATLYELEDNLKHKKAPHREVETKRKYKVSPTLKYLEPYMLDVHKQYILQAKLRRKNSVMPLLYGYTYWQVYAGLTLQHKQQAHGTGYQSHHV